MFHLCTWYRLPGTYLCFVFTYEKSMDQPGKVANPARGQLNRENDFYSCPRPRLRIWSRETGSAVPSRVSLVVSILRLNLCAYLRDSSRVLRQRLFIDLSRHTPSGQSDLLGHAIAYRWRSRPRVRRRRASKPQGSSKWVLPSQVTIDQLICAFLSRTLLFSCFSHSAHWLPTRKKLLHTVANPPRVWINRVRLLILHVVS